MRRLAAAASLRRFLGGILAGAVVLIGWSTPVAALAEHPTTTLLGTSCVSASTCESVGYTLNNAGFYVSLAEMWNGKSWRVEPTPNPPGGFVSLNGVSCISATFCEAVGSAQGGGTATTLAEVWNGTTWAIQPTPNPTGVNVSVLHGVSCVSVTFCEAVGEQDVGGTSATLAEVWNGTSWTLQPTPNPAVFTNALDAVSCVSATSCEAVGWSDSPGYSSLAEAWNGTGWTLQSPAVTGYVHLLGVSCASADDCEAVGLTAPASGGIASVAEVWNGATWTLQSTPTGSGTTLFAVSCVSAADCEAVGSDYSLGAVAEVWNGTSWTLQTVDNPSQFKSANLRAVSCVSAVACEASGQGVHKSALGLPLTEGWDGTAWTAQ
jgi:hypothetical protein